MPLRRPSEEAATRGRGVFAFLLLVSLLLTCVSLRACDERTLWVDEMHTLQLAQLPVPRLIDESARDVHPPGYALEMKTWLALGRAPWIEPFFPYLGPGTPWARGMNVFAWLLALTWAWVVGGAALGRGGGALLALGVGGCAAAAVVTGDLRGYSVAFAALFVAVVALTALAARPPAAGRPSTAALWTVYALSLALALWNHLLAGPAVALLAAAWLLLALRRRGTAAAWRLLPGLAAHATPWLLFLPWLVRVPRQMANLDRTSSAWMTPASVENLLAVFARWLPLGRASLPPAAAPWLVALGALAVVLPVAAWAWARRRGTAAAADSPAATLATLTLPVAVGSILACWLLARFGWAATFHAPRYPLIVAGPFAAGLVGAALAAAPRPRRAVLLLAPWLLAAFLGQWLALDQAKNPHGLRALRPQLDRWVAAGGVATMSDFPVLHVTPLELAPFVRHSFPGYEIVEPRWIVCSDHRSYPVDLLLDANPWTALDRPSDKLLARVLVPGRLAAEVDRHDFRDPQMTATAYRLSGFDESLAAELCDLDLEPRSPVPEMAVSAARPGGQLAADGWLFVDVGPDLVARRWSARPEVRLRFDREVPAGRYRLHLAGHREPYPQPVESLTLDLEGVGPLGVTSVPAGRFAVDLPVSFENAGRPRLTVGHPLWSPAEEAASRDRRWLGFQLEAAWLVPSAGSPPSETTKP